MSHENSIKLKFEFVDNQIMLLFFIDQNVVFIAIPVVFEKLGRIRVLYDMKNNGVENIILNPGSKDEKHSNIGALEV